MPADSLLRLDDTHPLFWDSDAMVVLVLSETVLVSPAADGHRHGILSAHSGL
jgi:hypothetical protein